MNISALRRNLCRIFGHASPNHYEITYRMTFRRGKWTIAGRVVYEMCPRCGKATRRTITSKDATP